MPFVQRAGLDLYYDVHGAGDPLLLLIGLGGSWRSWWNQLPAFSARYQVIVTDPRGSGTSSVPDQPYTTADMAADAVAILDHLGIEAAHVLGLSMGGAVAQQLAINWPERVGSLILTCCFARADAHARRIRESWAELLPLVGWERLGRMLSAWSFTHRFFDEQPELLQRLEAGRGENTQSPAAYRAQVQALVTHDTTAELHRITAPTMVMVGAEDILTPPRFARVLADGIPGAELRILPRGGHRFHVETPEPYNAAVLDFLERNPLGRRASGAG